MVGGSRLTQKICRGPFSISSVRQLLRQRCDALVFKPLPIEIIARQKVAPAFDPRNCRRWMTGQATSKDRARARETGPPGRACKVLFGNLAVQIFLSVLADRPVRQPEYDPELPFEIGPRHRHIKFEWSMPNGGSWSKVMLKGLRLSRCSKGSTLGSCMTPFTCGLLIPATMKQVGDRIVDGEKSLNMPR